MGISGTQKNNACSAGQRVVPRHVLLPCLLLPAGGSAFRPAVSVLQMGFFLNAVICRKRSHFLSCLKIQSYTTQGENT